LQCFGEHSGNKCDNEFAARLLLESEQERSEAAVLGGWDCHDARENSDDELDDSYNGFELRIDTDSDREDEIELVNE
jgi:hypothetical protein